MKSKNQLVIILLCFGIMLATAVCAEQISVEVDGEARDPGSGDASAEAKDNATAAAKSAIEAQSPNGYSNLRITYGAPVRGEHIDQGTPWTVHATATADKNPPPEATPSTPAVTNTPTGSDSATAPTAISAPKPVLDSQGNLQPSTGSSSSSSPVQLDPSGSPTEPLPPPNSLVADAADKLGLTGEKDCVVYMDKVLIAAGININQKVSGTNTTIAQLTAMPADFPEFATPGETNNTVLSGNQISKGVVNALTAAGLGTEIPCRFAQRGDLVQYWLPDDDSDDQDGHTAYVKQVDDYTGGMILHGPLHKKESDTDWTSFLTETTKLSNGTRAAYCVRLK